MAAEHTLNTLRYSDRVKELKSEGKGNKVAQAAAYAGPAALMEQGRGNFKLQIEEIISMVLMQFCESREKRVLLHFGEVVKRQSHVDQSSLQVSLQFTTNRNMSYFVMDY